MTGAQIVALFAAAIKYATVFIFGGTGETLTEKSGHLNMGIPGIMSLGALGGVLGERIYLDAIGKATPNAFLVIFIPILFTILFGALGGLLFSFFTVTLKCNHNVTGLTITTFGVGMAAYFIGEIPSKGMLKACKLIQSMVPYKWGDNWFGAIFLSQSVLTYMAIIIAIVVAIVLVRTRIGLNLRACGENPAAADAAGINVDAYRYIATIIGAAIASLGGMAFELDVLVGQFNPQDAVDALGWLCLSLVIFSMWKPGLCIGSSILFGFLICLPSCLPGISSAPIKELLKIVPYLATVVVLIVTSVFNKKSAQPPAALGITYFREDR